MLSVCTTLLGVGAPHPFAVFRVVPRIRPWEIAQDLLKSPCFPGRKKSTWQAWTAGARAEQQQQEMDTKERAEHTGLFSHFRSRLRSRQ